MHCASLREHVYIRILTLVFAASLICATAALLGAAAPAQAQTRATDVTAPATGNEIVYVPGTFSYQAKADLLDQANAIRKEACDQGVPDPRDTSRKLTSSDYVPIKWSSGLESMAQTRAAEASVLQSHTRPNGSSCFSYNGTVASYAEVLAWNPSASISGGIDQWYDEKDDWVNQDSSAVTGHYTSLIDPSNTYIGLGGFAPSTSTSYWGAVAGEFSSASGLDETQSGLRGSCDQAMEVSASTVSYSMGAAKISLGSSKTLKATGTVAQPGIWGDTVKTGIKPYGKGSWSSSNSGIATVTSSGTVKGVKGGTAQITATYGSHSAKATITVIDPKTVKTITINTATVSKAAVNKAIANAYGSSKYVTTVILGTKAKRISKGAFSGCPKLKTMQVKTKKLTKKSVKGSLKSSKVKTVQVKVGSKKTNKTYIAKYKKAFAKKNSGKKVKVK